MGNRGIGQHTLYIALGMAALAEGWNVFTGDDQTRRRPAGNLLTSLADLGAQVESLRGDGCAPIRIRGPLPGGRTSITCPTSQYLTALLISAPLARGDLLQARGPVAHADRGGELRR